MRGLLLNLPAIARVVGFAVIAIAIVVATLHFRDPPPRVQGATQLPQRLWIHFPTS